LRPPRSPRVGVVGLLQPVQLGQLHAVPLEHVDPLQRHERPLEQAAELRQDAPDRVAGADGDDHQRDVGVAGEEPRPLPRSVPDAVDAEEHGGACDAVSLQQVDDREGRAAAAGALAPPAVDRQLRRVARSVRQRDPGQVAGQQAGPLDGHQPLVKPRAYLVQHRFHAFARVDADGDERQVLGQRQQPLRLQPLLDPEPLGPAQQDGGSEGVALVQVEQLVGQVSTPVPIALAEVARQLQAVLVHNALPRIRPQAAAPSPAARLPTT
jgi:hypothetical protein